MTTVLEEYTTEEQNSVVRCLSEEEHDVNYIDKEMFSAYGGKCLSRKAAHK
jgi:hypothetical protein